MQTEQLRPDRMLSRQNSSFAEQAVEKIEQVRNVFLLASMRPDEVLEGVQSLDEAEYHDVFEVLEEQEEQQQHQKVKYRSAQRVLIRDKLSFVIGIALVWISAYQLGSEKQSFYKLYIVLSIVLFGARFVSYRMARTHYYMFDMCYFANLGMVIVLWKFPNPLLMKITFAYNAGPMAWSIIAMRNSLVLHSMDKIITLFMHWYPAVVSWTQRWYPNNLAGVNPMDQKASFFELGVLPLFPYIVWLLFYYLKLFVFSADKIQQRGYDTVYHWMLQNEKHPMSKVVLKYKQQLQPIVYLGIHGLLCWVSFLLTYVFYHSYWAHTIFLVLLSLSATWNGANYYFEVFAHRYIVGLGLDLKPSKKRH
eukprot:TRINITY_DN4557_c0_g1_i11.p1 TRINITY_DN4557_c0_g1~~TRINITY_DN4557_c0_g1_i11.p1  ORF type:complete len:400 (+),score=20.55 TRINITY_DN4557_c0_g1_i11:114-1202(+)